MSDCPTAPPGSSAAVFFSTLRAAGSTYAGAIHNGGRFSCPVHPDDNPSLDVTIGRNGKVVFRCSPCAARFGQDEFFKALRKRQVGWKGTPCKSEDVDWGERKAPSEKSGGHGGAGVEMTLAAEWIYRNEDGSRNFRVQRWQESNESAKARGAKKPRKRFVPYRWCPTYKQWEVGIADRPSKAKGGAPEHDHEAVRRTPLHVEEGFGKRVWIVEGEKACEALREAGVPATTFHGGADAPLPSLSDLSRWFGNTEVYLWADDDTAGVAFMHRLAGLLGEAGVSVAGIWSTGTPEKHGTGRDAFDWLAAGQPAKAVRARDVSAVPDYLAVLQGRESADSAPAVVVGGKELVNAGSVSLVAPSEKDPNLYSVKFNVETVKFVREYLTKHWRTAEGVPTLRYNEDDRFWLWDRRTMHYRKIRDVVLMDRIDRHLTDAIEPGEDGPEPIKWKKNSAEQVFAIVARQRSGGAMLPARGGVPFLNGWLDAESGELQPLTPKRDVRWCVQAHYKPGSRCPAWLDFLDSLGWGEDTEEHRLLRQWFGYLLSGETSKQKALLMHGPTRSGKGTILKIAKALLGEGATGMQMGTLAGDFGLQPLLGRTAALIGDARFDSKVSKSTVERLLSIISDDEMSVNVKNKPQISVRLGIRLMFATNERPVFNEASDALARRFLILNMTKSFLGSEDEALDAKLKTEIPGIVDWALEGLRDLHSAGYFAQTTAGRAMQEEFVMDSEPLRYFVNEKCELGLDYKIENKDLYLEYKLWAEGQGMFPLNNVHFGRKLHDAFPGQIKDAKSNGRYIKRGIRKRANVDDDDEDA